MIPFSPISFKRLVHQVLLKVINLLHLSCRLHRELPGLIRVHRHLGLLDNGHRQNVIRIGCYPGSLHAPALGKSCQRMLGLKVISHMDFVHRMLLCGKSCLSEYPQRHISFLIVFSVTKWHFSANKETNPRAMLPKERFSLILLDR